MTRFFFIVFLIIFSHDVIAQRPPNVGGIDSFALEEEVTEELIIQKVKLFPLEETQFNVTEFKGLHAYDPIDTWDEMYFDLGNIGSSHAPMFIPTPKRLGNTMGYSNFDKFWNKPEDFHFYTLNQAYTDLYFAPLGGQTEFQTKAIHSRDFKGDVNLTIDYHRLKTDGDFLNEDNKHTALSVGLWLKNISKRISSYISFHANNFNETNNGGILSSTLNPNIELFNINQLATNISNANTRHQNFSISLNNAWVPKQGEREFSIHYNISYHAGYYKYVDEGLSSATDSVHYLQTLYDDRGLRQYTKYTGLNNEVSLHLNLKDNWKLESGIDFNLQTFDLNQRSNKYNDVVVFGDLKVDLNKLKWNNRLDIGLGNVSENILFKSELQYRFSELFTLEGGLVSSQKNANIRDQFLFVNDSLFVENNFGAIRHFETHVSLSSEKTNTKIRVAQVNIQNPIYYDNPLFAQQLEGTMSGLTVDLIQYLNLGVIHFDHSLHYQVYNNNIFNLPSIWSKHELYADFSLFKKSLIGQSGFRLQQFVQDNAIGYQGLNRVFYSTEESFDWYPMIDWFFQCKVSKLRAFIKIEDILSYVDNTAHYNVLYHPFPGSKIRFGVRWEFLN